MASTTIAPIVDPISPVMSKSMPLPAMRLKIRPPTKRADDADDESPRSHSRCPPTSQLAMKPATSAMTMKARMITANHSGPQYWKSSSRYLGSGHRSSATIVSSSSATSRSAVLRRDHVVDEDLGLVLDDPRLVGAVCSVLELVDRVARAGRSARQRRAHSARRTRRRADGIELAR